MEHPRLWPTFVSIMKVTYYLLKGLFLLIGKLPLKVCLAIGRFISFVAEKVVRYRVSDATINISRSFPEMDYHELKETVHKFYLHFGDLLAESVWFGACHNPQRLVKSHICTIQNPELLNSLSKVSPSTIVLSSHMGNWELSGGIASYNYKDIGEPFVVNEGNYCVIHKNLASKTWEKLMRNNRTAPLIDPSHFEGYLETAQVLRYALKHRNEYKIYNFITDQSPSYYGSGANITVDFMNRRTVTMTGAAALAVKLGMSVVFQSFLREGRGHYRISYTAICENASEMTVEEIMQNYYSLLEKDLHLQPENYLWTHRRWKNFEE